MAPLRKRRAVALPDIFLDTLVRASEWPRFRGSLDEVARRGGGIIAIPMERRLGGNAANLAQALAALGLPTTLLGTTDATGRALLAEAAQATPLDVGHVTNGRPAMTVALECAGTNMMLSDAGALADFTWADVPEEAMPIVADGDVVAITNWSQMRHGTEVVASARDHVGGLLYLDTGDPSGRDADIDGLLDAVRSARVDVWSMNENEARRFSGQDAAHDGARALAAATGCRVDLHTRRAATSFDDDVVEVAADARPGRRVTGAGDHWNAGNIAGQLLGLDARRRLELAHAVATAYVIGQEPVSPTPDQLTPANV